MAYGIFFSRTTTDVPALRLDVQIRTKMKLLQFSVILTVCLVSAIAQDTLVLLDNLAVRETHSIFFKSLQGKSNRAG